MKRLFIILFFVSLCGFAQEPIYNINKQNLHLFNYAFFTYSDNRIAIDNSFEKYSDNRFINSSNLLYSAKVYRSFYASLNLKYHYLGAENNISSFDGVITYKIAFSRKKQIIIAGNIGMIKSDINFNTLETPYSFNKNTNTDFVFLNENNLNLGFSALVLARYYIIGFSANHINMPKLPYGDDKLPIKYTAFIRSPIKMKGVRKNQLVWTMIYQYQNAFLYNPIDLDYYFDMLNYFGANLEYNLKSWNFGMGYKLLSNNNNILTAQLGYGRGLFRLNYSFSYMNTIDKNEYGLFHQIGLYIHFRNNLRGKIGFRTPEF